MERREDGLEYLFVDAQGKVGIGTTSSNLHKYNVSDAYHSAL